MVDTVDFEVMMRGLMFKSSVKKKAFKSSGEKIALIYDVTSLGFHGMQIKSFFRPKVRRGKC